MSESQYTISDKILYVVFIAIVGTGLAMLGVLIIIGLFNLVLEEWNQLMGTMGLIE